MNNYFKSLFLKGNVLFFLRSKLLIFSYFIAGHKAFYAKEHDVMKNLEEIVNEVKPAVLIGITLKK